MSNIGVLVVEDNLLIALDIEMMLTELGYKFLGTYKDGDSALSAIKNKNPDLIIMDIHIKGQQDGIEIAEHVSSQNIPLIFITSSLDNKQYERAKRTNPAAYLIKPFQMLALQSAVELSLMKTDNPEISEDNSWGDYVSKKGVVFIKLNNVLYKVFVIDIIWIQVDGNYCYLNTKDKKYILKTSLKKILDKINLHADFIRVHKQYIVQIKDIKSVNASDSTLAIAQKTIPIGRTYKKNLMEKLQQL